MDPKEMVRKGFDQIAPRYLNLGISDTADGVESDWLGAEMYWSSFDAESNREMVRRAGFTLLEAEIHEDEEDGRLVPFLWILARK